MFIINLTFPAWFLWFRKVKTVYGYLDAGTENMFAEITFVESNNSVTVMMTQPYGGDGIWAPQSIDLE